MERIYTLWDTDKAYPIYTYENESDALAEVAAIASHGEDAVATWGLFLATPRGESREVVALGRDLIALAMQKTLGVYAPLD